MKKIITLFVVAIAYIQAAEVFATFETTALKSAKLAFSSSGIVKKVYVDVGSKVKKGDILATLHNEDLVALASTARAQAKFAESEYNRYAQVKNYINAAQLDSYRLKKENAQTQLKYNESVLYKTVLKAPFEGVITAKTIEEGDVVTAQAATPAFKMQSVGPLKLIMKYDARYYNVVKVGQPYIFQIGGKGTKYKATIRKIYPTIDEKTQMMIAEAYIKDMPSGLFGAGTITTGN
ncbi:MAG: efflux RND transporter periplasmic adaptor subunit [Sulfurovaceae bacterium]|nr:efflux RND transporter periplasmic adaptor subunit [Sulfurovaceae bacterium]